MRVGSGKRFQPGVLVGVGMDQDRTFEVKRVLEVGEDALVFDEPLRYPHAAGEVVSTEFVLSLLSRRPVRHCLLPRPRGRPHIVEARAFRRPHRRATRLDVP